MQHDSRPPQPLSSVLLICCLSLASAAQGPQLGKKALSGDRFESRGGRIYALAGIQSPRSEAWAGRARSRLDALVRGKQLDLSYARDAFLSGGSRLVFAKDEAGRDLGLQLAEEGLALPLFFPGNAAQNQQLEEAIARAQKQKRGLWAHHSAKRPDPLEYYRGVVLGLHSRSAEFDYGPFLDEIRAIHASHVLFIVPWFMDNWKSTELHPQERRTATFGVIRRAALQARKRGLEVALMPIVLLEEGSDDHWRGDIEPSSVTTWFWNYARFIGHWADLAREVDASLFSVGSELGSMESEIPRWRELIRSVRLRFGGRLTYSSNWDHYDSVRFWDRLDLVGMTGYHSLSKVNDPSPEVLKEAWADIRDRLLEFQKTVEKPLLFTELGYASQDGISKDPWNYYLSRDPDWEEQAACFRAAIKSWRKVPTSRYAGAFWYDWWQNRDPDDRWNYSIKGKPAEAILKRHFKSHLPRGSSPPEEKR